MKRLIPIFMPRRTGATNYFVQDIDCAYLDEFIARKIEEDGIQYTYRDLAVATFVRIFTKFPKFNRFFVKDRLYQRNYIDFCMNIHKDLRKRDEEVIVKVRFTGAETLREIKEKIDKGMMDAVTQDWEYTKNVSRVPQFGLRWSVRFLRIFDRLGWLSDKFLFKNSPFHSSIYMADLKSIGINYVLHHLYEFGNCGFFATLGKEHKQAIVDEKTDEIRVAKIMQVGVSMDERFVDGLYYRNMVKEQKRIIENLSVLEVPLQQKDILVAKDGF